MSAKSELTLPEDLGQCQQMILQMHEQMQQMQGQLEALLRGKYGIKSESIPAGQLRLFEETGEQTTKETGPTYSKDSIAKAGHGRRKPARELPRVRRVYDILEEEFPCPGCSEIRTVIGEETSEQYDYTPASIQIIQHVRVKRACKNCAEHVVVASKPNEVLERSLAAPTMLAYVATSKFADHLPLNRLEGIFKRDGAQISRSTMCDWMAATARILQPLYERMKERVSASEIIWTDDTPVKMQDREDERNMRNARVWVYIGDENNPYTIFDFTESRKRDGPKTFLAQFKGFLQADAFAGYDCIYAGGEIHEVACWAHARRKFFDALPTNSSACNEILALIQELYAVEKHTQESSPDERQAYRQAESVRILLRIRTFLDRQKLVALPKSPLGKAVSYALNNWKALNTFTFNGKLHIDNNRSERALRATAVGRKNWLFVGSAAGGKTAAIITSVLASCKMHNLHPRDYLADVVTKLNAGTQNFDSLLPDVWQPTCA